jgi:sugar phosphate isomerase/epimerase
VDIGYVASGDPAEALERAARLGFDGVELNSIWGRAFDLDTWTPEDSRKLRQEMDPLGVRVLAVGTGWANHLAPDADARRRAAANMRRAMDAALELGTHIVTCNAFGDPAQKPQQQVQRFGEVFGEYARWASERSVRIGIENCPHVHSEPTIQIGNIAYSPDMLAALFETVPPESIGLEYDPSHFLWLGVDYVQVIHDFADRLVYVHAKDTEILQERLAQVSIYGEGWWRYRMPGMGQLDWEAISRALAEVGYRTGIVIEHEDPVFEGPRFEEGLGLGLQFLRRVLLT